MKNPPVYKHPASYAREHDELAAYRASNQANAACKEAIEAAIRDHYRDNRLDAAAVDQVVQQFGYDRAFHILAITVCQADWDRRYSPDNRAWANAMSIDVYKRQDAACFVSAAGKLVEVVTGIPKQGHQLPQLRKVELHHISVNRHLAEIRRRCV